MGKRPSSVAKSCSPSCVAASNPAIYFAAKRMEMVGMLRPGTALMLAATLPNTTKAPKKGDKR